MRATREPASATPWPARVSRIAFIGLGAMGSRIARRLLDAGHDLVVWNRTPARAAPLLAAGAQMAATPAAAATRAEVVITMVADPSALRAVNEGTAGVAAAITPMSTVIEMSTVGPDALRRLVDHLPAGTAVLDAPVLGSIHEAETGTLRVLVGGPPQLFARWQPLLHVVGTPVHVGPSGSGAAAKLVANAALLGVLAVLGEAVALGRAVGLHANTVLEVLSATPLHEQATKRRHVLDSDPPTRFALSLAAKDSGLVVDAALAAGADVPLARAVRGWFVDAERAGLHGADYSTIVRHISRSSGWLTNGATSGHGDAHARSGVPTSSHATARQDGGAR